MKLEVVKVVKVVQVLCPTCNGKGNLPNQQNDSRAAIFCETCEGSGWLDEITAKRNHKIYWSCSDFIHHSHRSKYVAWLCGRIQKLFGITGLSKSKLDFFDLKKK